jgi:diguanylate cyclase (GGDEF)-like protein
MTWLGRSLQNRTFVVVLLCVCLPVVLMGGYLLSAALAEARTRILAVGLPALGLVAVVSFLAVRRLLRPVRLLSDGARRLSAGELEAGLPVHGHDEIAEATRAFNEMARRLREKQQRLEEAHEELTRRNEELISANRALEGLAITDGLTGLYNRRHFEDTLDREIRRHRREKRSFTLVLLDLDRFKQYNVRWGHKQGDAELRRVADQVRQSVRTSDMAFRFGGEELAVLLAACPQDRAGEVAEKIRLAVKGDDDDYRAHTTVSAGLATYPEHGDSAKSLVEAADAALHAAKAAGRDRVMMAEATAPRR